jgi:hypothetical protein
LSKTFVTASFRLHYGENNHAETIGPKIKEKYTAKNIKTRLTQQYQDSKNGAGKKTKS